MSETCPRHVPQARMYLSRLHSAARGVAPAPPQTALRRRATEERLAKFSAAGEVSPRPFLEPSCRRPWPSSPLRHPCRRLRRTRPCLLARSGRLAAARRCCRAAVRRATRRREASEGGREMLAGGRGVASCAGPGAPTRWRYGEIWGDMGRYEAPRGWRAPLSSGGEKVAVE